MKKPPTTEEKKFMGMVAALGCLCCSEKAAVHHILFGKGKSQRASHYLVLPLCPRHHQFGGFGVAIHAGQKTWEKIFGTELELLEKVYKRLGLPFPPKELTALIDKQQIRKSCLLK